MPYATINYQVCPHCGKTAYGDRNIMEMFAYENAGKRLLHCVECDKKELSAKIGKIEWAQCPHCGEEAFSRDKIMTCFGYRDMGNGNVIPQSYCKKCR